MLIWIPVNVSDQDDLCHWRSVSAVSHFSQRLFKFGKCSSGEKRGIVNGKSWLAQLTKASDLDILSMNLSYIGNYFREN
jgi:hypothetical protein